jgi:kumamolisin
VSDSNPNEIAEVTLFLKRREPIENADLHTLGSTPIHQRRYMTRDEFKTTHGAHPTDINKVHDFARKNGLAVVDDNAAARTVKLQGKVADLEKAFGVALKTYRDRTGKYSYRGRTGPVHLPDEVADVVTSVHGLDNRQQAQPHFRLARHDDAAAAPQPFTPGQVASVYNFPTTVSGKGQTIALIELGGGFSQDDLNTYFGQANVNPQVSSVSVDGADNAPTGDPSGPDGEVMLDIEVAGAIAGNSNIVVYFAPNTDQGFLNAVTTAIHDQDNKPSVVSISWGSAEINFTAQSMDAFNEVFKDASTLGVTVLVAAGDNGSNDNVPDGGDHVDFPAASPFVIACGGTELIANADDTAIAEETTWGGTPNDGATGGGVSAHFPVPDYQTGKILPQFTGRGVPDVAGNADPQSGYEVLVDGTSTSVGGTSAVAPLYAALVAQLNEALGAPVGFLNPILYNNPDVCSDVTQGTNGDFQAGPGWDATTGLGSINGNALLKRLQAAAGAGAQPAKAAGF